MITQLPFVGVGVSAIDRCLQSASPYDRQVKARLLVITMVGVTGIHALVHVCASVCKTVIAASQLIRLDYRQFRSAISLAMKSGLTAMADGVAVVLGIYMVVAPRRAGIVYKSLSLYQPLSTWRRVANRLAIYAPLVVYGSFMLSLALVRRELKSYVINISCFNSAILLFSIAFIYYAAGRIFKPSRTISPLPPFPPSPYPTIASDPNLVARLRAKVLANSVTCQLWNDAQNVLTNLNGKSLSIAVIENIGHQFGAQCRWWEGRIEIEASAPLHMAEDFTVFELCNMRNAGAFNKTRNLALQGFLSRKAYAQRESLIEFESHEMRVDVRQRAITEDSTFFPPTAQSPGQGFQFTRAIWLQPGRSGHLQYYGKSWDRKYSDVYNSRHSMQRLKGLGKSLKNLLCCRSAGKL